MDRYQLAKEFEKTVMCDRIQKITDVHELQQVCIALVDANFRLRDLKQDWKEMGWWPEA